MLRKCLIWILVVGAILLPARLPAEIDSPADVQSAPAQAAAVPRLSGAVICETLENFKPLNVSVVFSVQTGSVMCFTAFDRVPAQTSIFHDWIRHDKLIFRKKLILKPPSWASVSSIQLREADKGPWRVEIRDVDGNLLRILRFSITD
jgi:hypothetical protein